MDLQKEKRSRRKSRTYKERMVVRGYIQKEGIDYKKILSSVSMLESTRILLSIIVNQDFIVDGCQDCLPQWASIRRHIHATTKKGQTKRNRTHDMQFAKISLRIEASIQVMEY